MKRLSLLALAAALLPLQAASAAPSLSGQYGPLLIAVTGGTVTGAFSETRIGNGTDAAPQFSCAFLLSGSLKAGKASVVTWYPGQAPIAGQLSLSADGVSLKLKDDQPGCAMTDASMVDQAWESAQDKAASGWIGTRLIAARKAVIRKTADAKPGRTPYVLRDDAVAVLAVQGGAVEIAYPGPDKTITGWVNASDLTAAAPR
ncbi:MAG TPA: hypothetical protein VGL73_01175 [Caulobacteraceae bacterium]